MSRVAAIDCGTNSIRLLIADVESGTLRDLHRETRVVRLGQGVDATGRLADDALERTFAALDDYAALIRELGAEAVRFVATSASRDAENREVFVEGVRARLGIEPEVVSGAEEAGLSFAGAASVLTIGTGERVLVVDLGGGSTEFVLGDADGVASAVSINMGCVRLTERHLRSDPPTAEEIAAAVGDVDAGLAEALRTVPLGSATTLVGVAGSITTVTAHALALPAYQPERIHGAEISWAVLEQACTSLLGMSKAERAALPYMHPGRVDVIGAGAIVWRRIAEVVRELGGGRVRSALTSEHDILDGIALSLTRTI